MTTRRPLSRRALKYHLLKGLFFSKGACLQAQRILNRNTLVLNKSVANSILTKCHRLRGPGLWWRTPTPWFTRTTCRHRYGFGCQIIKMHTTTSEIGYRGFDLKYNLYHWEPIVKHQEFSVLDTLSKPSAIVPLVGLHSQWPLFEIAKGI